MQEAPQQEIVRALAPTGALRVTINLGNPILATQRSADQPPTGVSVDLAHALAARLGVPLRMLVLPGAAKAVDAVAAEDADVGLFAVDPVRGEEIAFTAPYLLIEGCYLVRDDSRLRHAEEVDRPGVRVAVGLGSAYDLFLTRELRHATIVRAPTSPTVVDLFMREGLEVAAGVRQQLEADAERLSGHRLLKENFMVIRQAMGVRKARGPVAAEFLSDFLTEMRKSGAVHDALERHRIQGATVAA